MTTIAYNTVRDVLTFMLSRRGISPAPVVCAEWNLLPHQREMNDPEWIDVDAVQLALRQSTNAPCMDVERTAARAREPVWPFGFEDGCFSPIFSTSINQCDPETVCAKFHGAAISATAPEPGSKSKRASDGPRAGASKRSTATWRRDLRLPKPFFQL